MAAGIGSPDLVVAVLDGPVAVDHPGLAGATVRDLAGGGVSCSVLGDVACGHGTAVVGMLVAGRDTPARGVCPGVPVVVRPIFGDRGSAVAKAQVLADAVVECVDAGARILNVSAAFTGVVPAREDALGQALGYAARHGVVVVAAAGNDGRVGGSPLLSHPWVIPVTATDRHGNPLTTTNLGGSIGRNGLAAPGSGITALRAAGGYGRFGGTSAAAPLVTGALALAWSAAPTASAEQVRAAAIGTGRRRGVLPPLLDAMRISQILTGL